MERNPWIAGFLVALRRTGVVARACEAVGIGRNTAEALRSKDGDFDAAWTDALEDAYDTLEEELLERALNGTPEPLTYQGAFSYEVERDASGNPVVEQYDTGSTDKAGNPIMASRTRLVLDAKGRPVPLTVRKKSDALLMFALKGRRKVMYAERSEVTGADGKAQQLVVSWDTPATASEAAPLPTP
jgi:hypothetical protein